MNNFDNSDACGELRLHNLRYIYPNLSLGKSAVLTWGYVNPGTEVILDYLAARRCAATLGIPVRGH